MSRGHQIAQKLQQASAWVFVRVPNGVATGTAFLADRSERLLVTNRHVVAQGVTGIVPETSIRVYFPESQDGKIINEKDDVLTEGRHYEVRIVDFDVIRDLAALQVVADLPRDAEPLSLARESCMSGDTVHSMGNPEGPVLWVYKTGTVQAVYPLDWVEKGLRVARFQCVETAEPLWHGDSGGPVVNDSGELVAVNESIQGYDRKSGRAIDVSEVRAFLDEVRPMLHPKTAADYDRRGSRHMSRGRFSEAWSDFDHAIRRHPPGEDISGYLVHRACAYEKRLSPNHDAAMADYDKAISDLTNALVSQPGDPELLVCRGRLFGKRGEPEAAKEDFEDALRSAGGKKVKPEVLAEAYYLLNVLTPTEDRKRKIEYLTQAIRLDAQNFRYHLERGVQFHDSKQVVRALADTERALTISYDELDPAKWIEIAPLLRFAYYNRADDLAQMNRRDEAKKSFLTAIEAALRFSPHTKEAAEFIVRIGREMCFRLNAFEDAKKALAHAETILPELSPLRVTYREKALYFVNNSQQNLILYVKYHTQEGEQWRWLPGGELGSGDWVEARFRPGEEGFLISKDGKIHGDRIRLYINNDKNETVSDKFWTQDLVVTPEPYLGYVPERYVLLFP